MPSPLPADRLARKPMRPTWLELSLDYRCNLRCLGCRACSGEGGSMTPQQAATWLKWGRAQGIARVWFGGGEPTLRPDLAALVGAARALGYREILVQTNGMRLAYDRFALALASAGASTFRLNLKSHRADLHDRLSGEAGAHALLDQALATLRNLSVTVVGDVLLTTSTAPHLADTIAHYAALGVRDFSLWLLSAADQPGGDVAAELPRLADLVEPLARAAERAHAAGVALASLHTPPCTLPAPLRPLWRPATSWGLVVVDPSGVPFTLERSPFEGGAFVPACDPCSLRGDCLGPRADYLARHGHAEFTPLAAT